jgi:3-oxoacyl-[acyl-carrier-protein] synthase III
MKDRKIVATKIDSVAVVAGNVLHHSAERLADHAVRDALAAATIKPADVDLLLNAGLFHDRMLGEPALAALIQEDVGANPEDPHGGGHGTFSFDVANGSAGVLSALQIADGFLRAGTIRHAVIVAGDANPGHGMAPGFPYDPVGAALVCGWDPSESGIAVIRWVTVVDAPARRDAVMRLEHGRNQLLVREDDGFAAEAAACAGTVVVDLLEEYGLRPDDVAGVAAAPFDTAFIDELVPHTGIAPDRFVRPGPMPRFHTAGLIASMAHLTSRAPAHGGEWVLLVAAGAGISAGAALLFR